MFGCSPLPTQKIWDRVTNPVPLRYCEQEVNYAAEQSKRFISVLHRELMREPVCNRFPNVWLITATPKHLGWGYKPRPAEARPLYLVRQLYGFESRTE